MPIIAIIFAVVASAGLWIVSGNSLGLWLGGFAVVAILVPPLCLRRATLFRRFVDTAVVVDGVAVMWLISAFFTPVSLMDWLLCTLVLYSFAAVAFGLAHAGDAMRLPKELAGAIATILLLGWLTSPVWLSHRMNDPIADALSRYHPFIAINSRLTELGIWLEQPVIYRHTVLGQDVAYAFPISIWMATLLHAVVGGCGFGMALIASGRRTLSRLRGLTAPTEP